jgi:hypothetical protein
MRLSTAVEMKLRLYRNHSTKLMLAWETCCRSDVPPPPPALLSNDRFFY